MGLGRPKALTTVYLLAAGCALYLMVAFAPPDNQAHIGGYGMMALWLLTFPWSVPLIVLFGWAFIHDTTNPIFLLYFAGAAAVNAYFIHRFAA